jgi:hypothetical protein
MKFSTYLGETGGSPRTSFPNGTEISGRQNRFKCKHRPHPIRVFRAQNSIHGRKTKQNCLKCFSARDLSKSTRGGSKLLCGGTSSAGGGSNSTYGISSCPRRGSSSTHGGSYPMGRGSMLLRGGTSPEGRGRVFICPTAYTSGASSRTNLLIGTRSSSKHNCLNRIVSNRPLHAVLARTKF